MVQTGSESYKSHPHNVGIGGHSHKAKKDGVRKINKDKHLYLSVYLIYLPNLSIYLSIEVQYSAL